MSNDENLEHGMWHSHKGPDSFGRDEEEFFSRLELSLEETLELNRRRGVNLNNPIKFNQILHDLEKQLISEQPRFEDFIKKFVDSKKKFIKL